VSAIIDGQHLCSKCKTWKLQEDFPAYRQAPCGLNSWCRACRRSHQNAKYASDPDHRARQAAYYRDRKANDPEYRERERERVRQYRDDPGYREQERDRMRECRSDPEYRERRNAQQRERYASDPEYREQRCARQNERNRERYATDPEYVEYRRTRRREWRSNPANRERIRERDRQRLESGKAFIQAQVLLRGGCADHDSVPLPGDTCPGAWTPENTWMAEWDHLPGFEKKFNIGNNPASASKESLLAEMTKCDTVCHYHHMLRSAIRRDMAEASG
jgi:hypothetical protein